MQSNNPKRLNLKSLQGSSGSTIVEILIATAVVAIVLTTVAAGLTQSVKNTSEIKYKALATQKAQEAVEVFRRERNSLGWETFTEEFEEGTYCFNTLPANTTAFLASQQQTCDPAESVAESGTAFTRQVVVDFADPDGTGLIPSVTVVSMVGWYDGNKARNVEITQQLFHYSN